MTICPLEAGTSTSAKPMPLLLYCYGRVGVNGSAMDSLSPFPWPHKDKIQSSGVCLKSTGNMVGSPYGNALCLPHAFLKGSLQALPLEALLQPLASVAHPIILQVSRFLTLLGYFDDSGSPLGCGLLFPFYHGLHSCRSAIESTGFSRSRG